MVADALFYGILIWAIAVSVIFVVFLIYVMRMMPHPLLMKVLTTLHAAMFGYESALIELIGSRGYKTHVFPKIVEIIDKLKGEDEMIDAVVKAKTPKEAMQKWINVLHLAKISEDAELIDKGNEEYIIKIPHCSMCNPIHETIGPDVKGICPMALIIVAASNFVKHNKVPEIDYSQMHPTGTTTNLKFVAPED
ncbi:MAG: hypothetical protein GF329_12735 [Candidatus Lokiarchaeota archaeon]|nr:hypothetical protein [Candidatus Lokiarchaeota archaeon]